LTYFFIFEATTKISPIFSPYLRWKLDEPHYITILPDECKSKFYPFPQPLLFREESIYFPFLEGRGLGG
jgi:hypothetical protein